MPSPLLHLQWKLKLLVGKFAWGNKAKHCWVITTNFLFSKVCWQCPAMFCLYTSSKLSQLIFEFSLKDGIASRLPFKIFLLYDTHTQSLFIKTMTTFGFFLTTYGLYYKRGLSVFIFGLILVLACRFDFGSPCTPPDLTFWFAPSSLLWWFSCMTHTFLCLAWVWPFFVCCHTHQVAAPIFWSRDTSCSL